MNATENRMTMPGPRMTGPAVLSLTSTPEEIASYIHERAKRTAADAHEIGTALKLAKGIYKKGQFGKFLKEHVPYISERTAQRYMQVAELPAALVDGKTLAEVYRVLFPEDFAPEVTTTTTSQKKGGEATSENKPDGKVGDQEHDQEHGKKPEEVTGDPTRGDLLRTAIDTVNTALKEGWQEAADLAPELLAMAEKILDLKG